MSIEKQTTVDQIEVTSKGVVLVRSIVKITENGVESSSGYHRHVVYPGQDFSDQDEKVREVCESTHTPEIIESFKAAIAAQGV
jgi:hypothetical protein